MVLTDGAVAGRWCLPSDSPQGHIGSLFVPLAASRILSGRHVESCWGATDIRSILYWAPFFVSNTEQRMTIDAAESEIQHTFLSRPATHTTHNATRWPPPFPSSLKARPATSGRNLITHVYIHSLSIKHMWFLALRASLCGSALSSPPFHVIHHTWRSDCETLWFPIRTIQIF